MKAYKLGDLVSLSKGKKNLETNQPTPNSKRMLHIGDLRNDSDIIYTNDSVGVEVFPGDILIAWDGANAGLVGFGKSGYLGSTLAVLRKNEKIDFYTPYLGFFLQSKFEYFQRTSNGATIPHLSRKALLDLKVPIPDYDEQIRIANLLDRVRKIIFEREKALLLLDELVDATFNKLFGNPVKNEKEWETKTILDLVIDDKNAIRRGPFGGALKKKDFLNNGYLVYEQYHALNNDFSFERYFIGENKFNELKAFEVKPHDIIISCSGIYLGKLAVVPENSKQGIINQALLKLTLDQEIILNDFFVYQWLHPHFKLENYGKKIGSSIPNFPPVEEFKKFRFIVPPIELQKQFTIVVNKIQEIKDKQKNHLNELKIFFESINEKEFKLSDYVQIEEFDKEKIEIQELSTEIQKENDLTHNKKKLTWENISVERISEYIKNHFTQHYFNGEMLLNYIRDILGIQVYYYSTAEQKKFPQLAEANDFPAFISDGLAGKHKFLRLEQVFYDAEKQNIIDISFTDEDVEFLNKLDKKEHSGIYFRIKHETTEN